MRKKKISFLSYYEDYRENNYMLGIFFRKGICVGIFFFLSSLLFNSGLIKIIERGFFFL